MVAARRQRMKPAAGFIRHAVLPQAAIQTVPPAAQNAAMQRRFVDLQGRQVHLRWQGQGAPVLLLHESPRSGQALAPLIQHAPPGLCLLLPDTPGNGQSCPLSLAEPDAFDYADALAALLDQLQLPRVAVYGVHTGAAIGIALAQRHPQRVAGLVLDGIGAFDAAERAQLMDSYLPPFHPALDGSHLAWLWTRVRDQSLFFPWNHRGDGARLYRPLPTAAALHALVMEMLAAGDAYRAPYAAAFRFRPAEVLPTLTVPVWAAAREDDVLRSHLDRLAPPVQVLPPRGPAWGAQVWGWLAQAAQGLPDATLPQPSALLSLPRLSSGFVDAAGLRWHLRGALDAPGRPRVWLHASPGGARALDAAMQRDVGQRPVLAIDLPGHGDTDSGPASIDEMEQALATLLHTLSLDDADLCGQGFGAWLADRQAGRTPVPPSGEPPPAFTPRADGGHLFAAWQQARDEAILGGWWQRQPRHAMGDGLDAMAIHAAAVEALKEAAQAAQLRSAWRQTADR